MTPLRLKLDGHRLTEAEVADLLVTLDMVPFASTLKADGYTLRPVRAPRAIPNNRATFRLCWEARDMNAVRTLRLAVAIAARPTA